MTIHASLQESKKAIAGLLPQDQALRYYQAEFSLMDSLFREEEERIHSLLKRLEILEKSR